MTLGNPRSPKEMSSATKRKTTKDWQLAPDSSLANSPSSPSSFLRADVEKPWTDHTRSFSLDEPAQIQPRMPSIGMLSHQTPQPIPPIPPIPPTAPRLSRGSAKSRHSAAQSFRSSGSDQGAACRNFRGSQSLAQMQRWAPSPY